MLRTGRSLWARLWLIASCAVLALSLPACKSKEKANAKARAAASAEKAPRIPISLKLTATEKKKAADLAKRVRRDSFPKKLVMQRGNAKLFVYLAATETDPKVILASLRAMRDSQNKGKSRRKPPKADEDYALVVTSYLDSENAKIQGTAIRASQPLMQRRKPYQPAVDALVSIVESHPQPGARIDALKALRKVKNFWRNDAILGATLRALDHDSPSLVATALLGAVRHAKQLGRKNDFKARVDRLLKHRSEPVRAQAAILAARLGADPALLDRIAPLLGAKTPFARAAAVRALADLGDVRAIHALMPLLGDSAVEMHRISYQSLTGRRTTLALGSSRRTVHDRVIDALVRLSAKTELKFEPKPADVKDPEKARKAAVTAAKAWYARVKNKLPKYEPPPAPVQPTAKSDQAAPTGKAPARRPAPPAAPPAQPQP